VGSTSSVVPANRLGQLLAEARLRQGADLEEFASRSDFTVGELSDFEAGHRSLDDSIVSEITGLYEIDCGPIVPHRAELTIDLTDKRMSAAGHAVRLDSAAHDHVLDRYLSLVYVLRNHSPGTTVPLRDEDVAILAASLAEREELITEQLRHAMAEERESVNGLVSWFRRRLWVPTAGAMVGVVSIGTLVMVTTDAGAPPAPNAEPEPDPTEGPNAAAGLILPRGLTSTSTSTEAPSSPETTGALPTPSIDAPNLAAPSPTSAVGSRPAETVPTTTASIARTPASMGAQAEALLPFDWQSALPGWKIVYAGPDQGFRGLTYPYDKTIEMFVRDDDTAASLAGILAHEIGHAIDVTHLSDGDRDDWREARNIENVQWWPDAYASDFHSGAGDFAEAFAYWALGDPSSSQVAGTPTQSQLQTLRSIVGDVV